MINLQCPLKSDPWQRVIPLTPHFLKTYTIERVANAVGMSIPPPATTENSLIKHFFLYGGGGITLQGSNFTGDYR